MSWITINRPTWEPDRWDVYSVDKDGQSHYAGEFVGWQMWAHSMSPHQPPHPMPMIMYITDEGVPEVVPIHGTRMKRRLAR